MKFMANSSIDQTGAGGVHSAVPVVFITVTHDECAYLIYSC